jgi:polar amino acid transport system permease protein
MIDFSADSLQQLYFILTGSLITLQYSCISVFFGAIIGIFLAICKVVNIRILSFLANCYTSLKLDFVRLIH